MDTRVKERKNYWSNILLDWQKTRLPLAEFARKSCVSYGTIWYWKKRLGIKHQGIVSKHKSAEHNQLDTGFVPVRIIDSKEVTDNEIAEIPIKGTGRLEVLLRGGHGIRFDNTCSLQFVQSVVKMLEVC